MIDRPDLDAIAAAAGREAGGVPPGLLGDYLTVLVDVAAGGRRLVAHELAGYTRAGEDAAQAGVPLRGLVDLYLSATWRFWRRLPDTPASTAGLRAAGLAVLRASDDAVAAVAEGFERAHRAVARREEAERREFVDDLLSGRADVGDLVVRGERFGLRLAAPHQVLLVAAPTPFTAADPLTQRLDRAIADAVTPALVATRAGRLAVVTTPADPHLRHLTTLLTHHLGPATSSGGGGPTGGGGGLAAGSAAASGGRSDARGQVAAARPGVASGGGVAAGSGAPSGRGVAAAAGAAAGGGVRRPGGGSPAASGGASSVRSDTVPGGGGVVGAGSVAAVSAGRGGGVVTAAVGRRGAAVRERAGWRVAVGRAYPGPGGVLRSHDEAAGALDIAERLGLAQDVVRAADLLVYQVVLRDRAAITDLVATVLTPLAAARGGAGPLLDTLDAYYAAGGVAALTARRMRLSVRTITYRLERVRTLTGYDPADPAHTLPLHVAVVGARLLNWPQEPLPPI